MKSRKYSIITLISLVFITGLFGVLLGGGLFGFGFPQSFTQKIIPGIPENKDRSDTANIGINVPMSDVAEQLIPTVVGISTVTITEDLFYEQNVSQGVGSGVIVSPDGYILTNDHVVGDASKITAILANGEKMKARRLWSDPSLDLAVIKVNAKDFPYARLGDSDSLRVGDPALAIGNPLGLRFQRTVTAGIISALNRVIAVPGEDNEEKIMENLIQTDASINPGNSGGPLVNARAEVIGINTAKIEGAEGINFSIPINIAKPILKSITKDGKFVKPGLGIAIIDKEMAEFYNGNLNIDHGLLITDVAGDSPADRAGLRPNDIITRINTRVIDSTLELKEALYSYTVGETVTVTFIRNGKTHRTDVTLREID
ncbi:S1C family serine protease [Desulfolucanica intricata]|uniref:S1C family serine protease n=1 Tax=Desulfolucanica intricata TaxID=1285191 RepID=UPI000834801B|nr:trypsin-like peptidase domain-containing protein [Desulfolucanica intricata]